MITMVNHMMLQLALQKNWSKIDAVYSDLSTLG